jgi:hypothetical protein
MLPATTTRGSPDAPSSRCIQNVGRRGCCASVRASGQHSDPKGCRVSACQAGGYHSEQSACLVSSGAIYRWVAVGSNQTSVTKVSSLSMTSANPASRRICMRQWGFEKVACISGFPYRGAFSAFQVRNDGKVSNGAIRNDEAYTTMAGCRDYVWLRTRAAGLQLWTDRKVTAFPFDRRCFSGSDSDRCREKAMDHGYQNVFYHNVARR